MTEVIKVEDCGNNIRDYDIPIYNAIIIPEGATNGDMIKAMFPSDANELDMSKLHLMYDGLDYIKEFRKDWWNTPYKRSEGNTKRGKCE